MARFAGVAGVAMGVLTTDVDAADGDGPGEASVAIALKVLTVLDEEAFDTAAGFTGV